jgi:putative membrane protein
METTLTMQRLTRTFGAAGVFVADSNRACADLGTRLSPGEAWSAWSADPLVIFVLAVSGCLYYRGWSEQKVRKNAHSRVSLVHAVSFYLALLLTGVALLSPLDALGQALTSAHMAQHMLLMLVIAPLLVIGAPALVFAYAVPRPWRHVLGLHWLSHRCAWHPLFIWWLYALSLWGWHHPVLYQGALRDPLVHDAQHLSFIAAAFLFWRIVIDPISRRKIHPVAAVPYLFTTSIHASALGIFMSLSPWVWYQEYVATAAAFGLSSLADQQLAGLLMWIPGCMAYPLVMVVLMAHWLATSETRQPQWQRQQSLADSLLPAAATPQLQIHADKGGR